MKLFWYEIAAAIFAAVGIVLAVAIFLVIQGTISVDEQYLAKMVMAEVVISALVAFTAIPLSALNGPRAVIWEIFALMAAGAVFLLFAGAAGWWLLCKDTLFFTGLVKAALPLLAVISATFFVAHIKWERPRLFAVY